MALEVEQLQEALMAANVATDIIRDTQGALRRIESSIANLREATLAEITGGNPEDRQRLAYDLIGTLAPIPAVIAHIDQAMQTLPVVADRLRDGWEPPKEEPEDDD